jgi:NAD(P)H-hydrate epimerase
MSRYKGNIPQISTEEMIEVDRLMIEEFEIELIQMMENAGRNLALLARTRYLKNSDKVIVLAGTGGNGGGALVCARRLCSWGYQVDVAVTSVEKMKPITAHQLRILQNMNISIISIANLTESESYDLIIDGLIGYSLKGNPIGISKEMIDWTNLQKSKVLSLDTPSGIDLTDGLVFAPAIKANATLTLALPKKGLFHKDVIPLRGELYLGDISVPPGLYKKLGLNVESFFSKGEILRID